MKYWLYINGEVPGNYSPEELVAMPDFSDVAMVCPVRGEIAQKNWSRAGEFPEIAEVLSKAPRPAPMPPSLAQDSIAANQAIPKNPDDILNDSSARIFAHVTELMKEMENRREERALIQSLQRQLMDLKNELTASHERIKQLESQKTALRLEMERVQRSERNFSEDIKHHRRLNEDFSKQLAQKEFSLAKALGLIRKLEEMLEAIQPKDIASARQEALAAPMAESMEPAQAQQPMVASFTSDSGEPESPQAPPEGEVHPIPAPWQAALSKISSLLRKPSLPDDGSKGSNVAS